jgi:hypothetical protein
MHRPSKQNAADSPERALLSRRWNVVSASLLGHSVRINAHFIHDNEKSGKTSPEGQSLCWKKTSIWYTCRHLDVNIALVLRSFGVEGSDLRTSQSETLVSSFVTNVPYVCCVFHYRPPYYVNLQQLYSSQHRLVLKTYKSTHNIRTLDHQQHVFLCCKDI